MKLIRFFIAICFFVSCNQEKNNSELLASINSISKIDTTYTLQVDELRNIIDTLSMQLIKKNNTGCKVYEEIITPTDDDLYIIKNYYGEDSKIFYTEKSTLNFGVLSILENFKNEDDIIINGLQIFYQDNQPYDTILLKYNYVYKDNAISVMGVDYFDSKNELLGSLNTLYNDKENPVKEYFVELNDTLKITDYSYNNDRMYQTKTFDIKNHTTVIEEYKKDGEYEQLISKRIFEEKNLILEELFEIDKSGNILLLRRQ